MRTFHSCRYDWLHANTHRTCAWISHTCRANDAHIIQWRKMSSNCFSFVFNIEVYGDKTMQVWITVSFVLKFTGNLVLTRLHTGPKKIPVLCISSTVSFCFVLFHSGLFSAITSSMEEEIIGPCATWTEVEIKCKILKLSFSFIFKVTKHKAYWDYWIAGVLHIHASTENSIYVKTGLEILRVRSSIY